jgi:hypothetical protein
MIKNFGKLALIGTIAFSIVAPFTPASAQSLRIIEHDDDRYDRDYRYYDDDRDDWIYRYDNNDRDDWRYRYDNNDRDNWKYGYDYDDDYDDYDDRGYVDLPRIQNHRRFENGNKYGWQGKRLVCESISGRYNRCNTNARYRNSIRFYDDLDSRNLCREGYSWGFDRDGLWVSNGCRGVFEILP